MMMTKLKRLCLSGCQDRWKNSLKTEFKSLLDDMTNALILVAIMAKSNLKYRLSCKKNYLKISTSFLFQNGTYLKNISRNIYLY